MAIEKIKSIYPMGIRQSIVDVEELTALELASRTANKVNEVIDVANMIEASANEARQVVDEMVSQQSEFIEANNDIRNDILTDYNSFKEDLNDEKTVFTSSLNSNLETLVLSATNNYNNALSALNTRLNTTLSSMSTELNNFKTDINSSKASFLSGCNIALSEYRNNANTALSEYRTSANTALSVLNTALNNTLTNFQNDVNTEKTEFVNTIDGIISSTQESANSAIDGINPLVISSVENKIDEMVANEELSNIIEEQVLTGINSDIKNLKSNAINILDYGAFLDGVTDDSAALQNAIDYLYNNGGGTILLNKTLALGSTVSLKSGVTLMADNAKINVISDVNVFKVFANSNIKGYLEIDCSAITFTSDVLLFDGSVQNNNSRNCFIENVYIQGNNATGGGNAIHLSCPISGSNITFLRFESIVIKGFTKGIFLDCPPIQSGSVVNYINGNTFHNIVISDCDYCIYLNGDRTVYNNQTDGNIFTDLQLQYNARMLTMIHVNGWGNYFQGIAWDVAGNSTTLLCELTSKSRYNRLNFNNVYNPSNVINYGLANKLDFSMDEHYVPYKEKLTYRPNSYQVFHGNYEDILHKANILHDVSITSGSNYLTGDINNVFNDDTSEYVSINLGDNSEFTFEITFKDSYGLGSANLVGGFALIGFYFPINNCPKEIITTADDGVNTPLTATYKCNKSLPVQVITNGHNLDINLQKLTITFRGNYDSSSIRFARMFGTSFYVSGKRYLSNGGGNVCGNLNFMKNTDSIILLSPNNTKYKITVDDEGNLSATQVTT